MKKPTSNKKANDLLYKYFAPDDTTINDSKKESSESMRKAYLGFTSIANVLMLYLYPTEYKLMSYIANKSQFRGGIKKNKARLSFRLHLGRNDIDRYFDVLRKMGFIKRIYRNEKTLEIYSMNPKCIDRFSEICNGLDEDGIAKLRDELGESNILKLTEAEISSAKNKCTPKNKQFIPDDDE